MESAPLRFVVIGGVAAGASAVARARRLSEEAEITLIERGIDISFANCGMPYFIGGEITDRAKLALHTPKSLGDLLGIQILTQTEATAIDRSRKVITVKNLKDDSVREIGYDKLLLAPGSRPIRPPLPGIQDSRILTLRNLQDMDRIKESVSKSESILVVGAGFIGLEMVEMLHRLHKKVTLVELLPQVLPQMDAEMTKQIEVELQNKGVELILNDGIMEFAELDSKECIRCGKCVSRCQVNAITQRGKKATPKINLSRCIGCGLCVTTCPKHCIQLKKRENAIVPPTDEMTLYRKIFSNKKTSWQKFKMLLKIMLRMRQ